MHSIFQQLLLVVACSIAVLSLYCSIEFFRKNSTEYIIIEEFQKTPASVISSSFPLLSFLERTINHLYNCLMGVISPRIPFVPYNGESLSLFMNISDSRFYNSEEALTPSFHPFNYSQVYFEGSSRLREVKQPIMKWISGPPAFRDYMNSYYIPFHQQHTNDSNPFVYLKRGTTGIAGQMRGVCDVLLMSIIYNRVFKMVTPSIQPFLFDSPLYNLTYPITYQDNSTRHYLYGSHSAVRSQIPDIVVITYKNATEVVGKPGNFSDMHPDLVGISSLHTFFKHILKNKYNRDRMMKIGQTNQEYFRKEWYNVCMQSLFQPSAYLNYYLQPYYEIMKNHVVIGIHIRQGGVLLNWKDSVFRISMSGLYKAFKKIDYILRRHPDALLFVASDSKELVSSIIQKYGSRVFGVDRLNAAHVGKRPSEEGLLRASMELVLLSKCDYLFLTAGSGFSQCGENMNPKVDNPYWIRF